MSAFPELDEIVDAMAGHDVTVVTFDQKPDPDTALADTLLSVRVPGAKLQNDPYQDPYSHAVHRYPVIGGQDITWVGPGVLGSTTRGAFGGDPADDDVIDAAWAEILQKLGITNDPHARAEQD
ncbi:hypothetical protein [Gordonia malaquae]|uniref:hypothetical protein n=1 Tax=Gordonia malaquae TaxID=410332 RepID=UPI00301802C4